ncbi:DUF1285 domain-containing protein [Psychrobacter sp. P11G5]|uniref:DUF1285 domain-containing protein n=1 Tax=Psychrobacter sp. P11G5 TaxID=1699624 RepID=UPI00082AAF00|nr:DUF1285 domain-containing protein [Psychrobacter sp. P11G5]
MSSKINNGVDAGNSASSSIADNVNNSGTTQDLSNLDSLSNYLKSSAGTRQGRSIPPLDEWHPEQVADMDLVIKANGEWWHEGGLVTRQSLVSLFATILWKEESNGTCEYFLKTPVQKLRIQVEDVPLLINDVGIVTENGVSWLEFTTTTGDVVRLDNEHPIELRSYKPTVAQEDIAKEQVRPYMLVRNDLTALIGRNTFYHLTEIGKLTEQNDEVILTLESGGKSYQLLMPDS